MNYKFHNVHGTETHTKSTICFVPNEEEQYQVINSSFNFL